MPAAFIMYRPVWKNPPCLHSESHTQTQYSSTFGPFLIPTCTVPLSPLGSLHLTPPCHFPTGSCLLSGQRPERGLSCSWRVPPPADLMDRSLLHCEINKNIAIAAFGIYIWNTLIRQTDSITKFIKITWWCLWVKAVGSWGGRCCQECWWSVGKFEVGRAWPVIPARSLAPSCHWTALWTWSLYLCWGIGNNTWKTKSI